MNRSISVIRYFQFSICLKAITNNVIPKPQYTAWHLKQGFLSLHFPRWEPQGHPASRATLLRRICFYYYISWFDEIVTTIVKCQKSLAWQSRKNGNVSALTVYGRTFTAGGGSRHLTWLLLVMLQFLLITRWWRNFLIATKRRTIISWASRKMLDFPSPGALLSAWQRPFWPVI